MSDPIVYPVHSLINLDFVFAPVMSGTTSLSSGEIINGTAGQVNITGSGNTFIQGTSSASSSAGGHGGDDMAQKAMEAAKRRLILII